MADGFSMAWDGMAAFEAALTKISTQADVASKEIVSKSAAVLENAAKANFEGAHKKGQPHVGGVRPNIVTGSLRRSIRSDPVVRYGLGDYGTRVYPRVIYARRVELGMNGKGAHPYFTPAYEAVKPELEAIARATWARFLTG